MKLFVIFLLYLISAFQNASAGELTIEEAYQAIPHRRAPYNAQRSTLSAMEREYLAKLFALSDEALVARITTLTALREGNRAQLDRYEEQTTRILQTLQALPEPGSASGFAATLGQAIEHQRTFFRTAFAMSPMKEVPIATDPHVRSASNELQQLYANLMIRYSGEHPYNRDAFYQHLCALDFL